MLKKFIMISSLVLSYGFAGEQILGITEYNSLSPIETKKLGEISPQTKAYLDTQINKKVNEVYNKKIKKEIKNYLNLVSKKLTKKQKKELRTIIYELKKENAKIISQNSLLLKRYGYLLRKYKEAHIITTEDLKRLMIGEAKEVHDTVIYKKTITRPKKSININSVFQ